MKGFLNSVKGIVTGVVLVLVCIGGLSWNEWNNVRNIKAVDEARKSVIQIDSENVNPENDGKLVAVNGALNVLDETVTDSLFHVSAKTAKLMRTVEMYQWEESVSEDDKGNQTYSYSKVWLQTLNNSGGFNDKSHINPEAMPFISEIMVADEVKLGEFSLSEKQKESLSAKGTIRDFDLQDDNYTVIGEYITNAANISSPDIGDVRISYTYNDSGEISLLACQQGNTFTDYRASNGVTFNKVVDGLLPGTEVIQIIQEENNILKWAIRGFGTLLMFLGFALVFKPLSVIGAHIPFLGVFLRTAVGLAALLLGLSVSLIVIAIAWIAVRPLIGIGLIAGAAVMIFILTKAKKPQPAGKP
ncbi:MAG: TMEM43 family protein [Oscillospiraceae bacterium]|nr:TMEM43 family protein [Oscillospiraceae bacterium]